jgi:hypothetical protein
MSKAAQIPFSKIKMNVLIFGILNFGLYLSFFFSCKHFNIMHITGLRMVNFLILSLTALVLINRWKKQYDGYFPFLTVFSSILLIGVISFMLFAIFIFFYAGYDPELTELFVTKIPENLRQVPAIVILFEGTAGSIIVALILMIYTSMINDSRIKQM